MKVLAAERRRAITNLMRRQSSVRVEDLCTRFGASASTIRRDLEYLERRGTLKRTYGGAIAADGDEVSLAVEDTALSEVRSRIGAATAALISEGETVFLGPGPTTLAVAQHLVTRSSVTVVTNALNVATYLTAHSHLPVIVTGGQVDRPQTALLGHLAQLTLRELRADRAIIGVGGIHVPDGVTGESLPGVQFLRSVIELMPELVIVADSGRWGRVGPAFLAALEAIDVIVTDLNAPAAMVWDLAQLGIQVIQT
jgi:DeoR/GlpR family transcriptional regulator of sugar metabolism